jgi:hypothetical protein
LPEVAGLSLSSLPAGTCRFAAIGKLHPEICILDSNGLMTPHQGSDQSKDGQEEDWRASRLFVFFPFQVNLL